MLRFVLRRLAIFIPMLWLFSVVAFLIIQAPPGDYLTDYIARLRVSGETVDQDLTGAIKGLREGERFLGDRVPKSAWTVTGAKGLEVTQTFDDAPADFTRLVAYPDYLGKLEAEVWLKAVTLKPNGSLSFIQGFEVTKIGHGADLGTPGRVAGKPSD